MKKSIKQNALKLNRETIAYMTTASLPLVVGGFTRESNSRCVSDCLDNCPNSHGCPG